MTWTDLSGAFGYGTKLTSAQMQQLRDNIEAVCDGDSGAPEISPAALGYEITLASGGGGRWAVSSKNCIVSSYTSMATHAYIPFEHQSGFNNIYLIGRVLNAVSGKTAAWRLSISGIGNSGEINATGTSAENEKSSALNISGCTPGVEYAIELQGDTDSGGTAVLEGFIITMSE